MNDLPVLKDTTESARQRLGLIGDLPPEFVNESRASCDVAMHQSYNVGRVIDGYGEAGGCRVW
jgi:hypothetical protein